MWEAANTVRLSATERELLEGFARAGSTPQKIALRIRIPKFLEKFLVIL